MTLLTGVSANPIADSLIQASLREAEDQLGFLGRTSYEEARIVERAIENLAVLDDEVRLAMLKLMWRMQRDGLYAELEHPDMLSWALSNPVLNQRWSKSTIDRYAKAISRILPEVYSNPLITDDGEIIGPDELLERASMSALSDYSYTFANTQDDQAKKEMLLSVLRHDGEAARDAIIREIRNKKNPLPPVTVYTYYEQDSVSFSGTCSVEQWQTICALLGSLWDERFAEQKVG